MATEKTPSFRPPYAHKVCTGTIVNMESAYNKDSAKQSIDRLADEGQKEDETCLHGLLKDPEWFEGVRIKEVVKDKVFALVIADDNGNPTEDECIFTVYGAISKKDLPPLKAGVKQIDQGRIKFLKQAIRLDGLGSERFKDAVVAAGAVWNLFDRVFEEGVLESWKDGLAGEDNNLMDMSNLLVTSVKAGTGQQHIPFDAGSDPHAVMDSLIQKGYMRTEDNIVQYSESKVGLGGKRRYEKIGPQAFRIGDIVAAQLSFKAIALKEGRTSKSRMIVVLRSLTLLAKSSNFRKEPEAQSAKVTVTLKRKLRPLEDAEVYDVRKRINDMSVDDEQVNKM
ncbi:hypothetical protein FPV67DRAFT_1784357 [Lyophyllum atratum]|nr:hypothetical protein FPV67DRAFT_1716402 [Lyophyllum atratum]KAF8059877.1 hypothetical protein FPV67DRAFT_1784357 [Lyophyllum atratum]